MSAVGLALTLLAPYVVHGLTFVDRGLLQLLRRARSDERIRTLEETRARAVDAADAERRRIERDLHDGAQQRFVALGVDLGRALEKSTGPARRQSSTAGPASAAGHGRVARPRARHPAGGARPTGACRALAALAARSPVPVGVRRCPERASPASSRPRPTSSSPRPSTNVASTPDAPAPTSTSPRATAAYHRDHRRRRRRRRPARGSGLRGLAERGARRRPLERREPAGRRHPLSSGDPMRVVIAEDPVLLREGLHALLETPARGRRRRRRRPRAPGGGASAGPTSPSSTCACRRPTPTRASAPPSRSAPSTRRSACSSSRSTSRSATPSSSRRRTRRRRLPAQGPRPRPARVPGRRPPRRRGRGRARSRGRLPAARPSAADGPLEELNAREREVLALMAEGRSNDAIA